VIGVFAAALSFIGSGILYCCYGIGRKKKTEQATQDNVAAPHYKGDVKGVVTNVTHVGSEGQQ
jgi:hypothetical protein